MASCTKQPKADVPHCPGCNLVPADFTGNKELFQLCESVEGITETGKENVNWLLVLHGRALTFSLGCTLFFKIITILISPIQPL